MQEQVFLRSSYEVIRHVMIKLLHSVGTQRSFVMEHKGALLCRKAPSHIHIVMLIQIEFELDVI